ncbi:MAG: MBOAT family protein [Clostridia bacterium]|nr:MBOAT family protein [Clostridia bacterium]
MAFTTQTFTFVFFPLCMAMYYVAIALQSKGKIGAFLAKCRLRDFALIGIGAVFYAWACFDDLFRFAVYIVIVYVLGLGIEMLRRDPHDEDGARHNRAGLAVLLFAAVAFVVYVLVHFKYLELLADVWNWFFKDTVKGKTLIAPLGISFITFSAVSYLADIYMGKATAGSLIDCALYMSFFPKVVSGPIVLWRDFKEQVTVRRITLDNVSDGMSRVMIGFAKKLILADTFGACIATASSAVDVPTAWGIGLLYMLQIYYDFSGYSDIALGLSKMMGFSFKENFNFPYLSCSITEFWRRWHISLGTWFREYIYFPLGGSRKGKTRALINVAIVFVLTGIWHGAGWTYMLWGAINGACNIFEKVVGDKKWYQKTPKILKWAATMAVTFFCWELFRFTDFTACKEWFKVMFGVTRFDSIPYSLSYYFDTRMIVLVVVAILGATVFGWPKVQAAYQKFLRKPWGYAVCQLVFVVLFAVAILFMVNSTYSPFIYFQY